MLRERRCVHPTIKSVFPKSEMSSVFVVVAHVFFQQPPQVPLVENDHVVEQVPPYAANPALRNSVLPGAAESGSNRLAAHRLYAGNDVGSELCVAIENQETMRLLGICPSIVQLQRDPERAGITSNIEMQDSTTPRWPRDGCAGT